MKNVKISLQYTLKAWTFSQFIHTILSGLSMGTTVSVRSCRWSQMNTEAVIDLSFTLLTSQVNSITFYSEHEKSDKFCSEVLISARGSFTCHKFTTWRPMALLAIRKK